MKTFVITAVAMAAGTAIAGIYGDTPDAKHAWAVHDWNRPKPSKVEPAAQPGQPPSDAIVLFDGTKDSLDKNWQNGKGGPTGWKYSDEGFFYCDPKGRNGGEIRMMLAGFDDISIAALTIPSLTTIHQPCAKIATGLKHKSKRGK